MPAPHLRGPYEGPPLEQLQNELRVYMRQLTAIHEAIYTQEQNRGPKEEEEVPCPVVPGDQVYLRVFRRRWNEPRREGPYTVVRATPTAVQVEGSTTWYHLNHCTRVPRLRPRGGVEECDQDEYGMEAEHARENNTVDEPHSRAAERTESGDEMQIQDGLPPPMDTEQEGERDLDIDLSVGTHAAMPPSDSRTPADLSPERGPSANRHQQEEFDNIDFQDIDLPDIDFPDIDFSDFNFAGLDLPDIDWGQPS